GPRENRRGPSHGLERGAEEVGRAAEAAPLGNRKKELEAGSFSGQCDFQVGGEIPIVGLGLVGADRGRVAAVGHEQSQRRRITLTGIAHPEFPQTICDDLTSIWRIMDESRTRRAAQSFILAKICSKTPSVG